LFSKIKILNTLDIVYFCLIIFKYIQYHLYTLYIVTHVQQLLLKDSIFIYIFIWKEWDCSIVITNECFESDWIIMDDVKPAKILLQTS
jgi:hypothetical protein